MRRQLIDEARQLMPQRLEQIVSSHAGLLAQRIERIAAERICQVVRGDRLVRAGADPGVRRMAVAALLESPEQVAEAAAQHAAGRGAAEQSAQSALEEVAQVAARGGTGRRGRRPVAEQPAEDVREAATAIAGCRAAGGRYAGRLSAGTGGVAAAALECLVRKQAEDCLLYTSPSPRDGLLSRMPSSA